jgi:hypothetical protein
VDAKIFAADGLESSAIGILQSRGHELVVAEKTPKPAELLALIGDYEGLIVRRCARRRGRRVTALPLAPMNDRAPARPVLAARQRSRRR